MSSVRAFLAIPLEEPLRRTIAAVQTELRSQLPDVRWSRPETVHLTLEFFGETTQENVEKIAASVLSVKRCRPPFTVDVIGLGAFPGLQRPRVLWLDLTPKDQLRQLHRDCQKALHQAGLRTDSRPYSPHLTIGRARRRIADLTELAAQFNDRILGRLRVDRLILFASHLHPGGAVHTPLATVNLDDDTKPFE